MKSKTTSETVSANVTQLVANQLAGDRKAEIEKQAKALKPGEPVPMMLWGKDHYSTFAYLECRAVDNKGIVDFRQMRGQRGVRCKYPTFLAMGVELEGHSDWSCMDDIEDAGLIINRGSGLNPLIELTEKGHLVAVALRAHKSAGGSFGSFSFPA